MKKLSQDQVDSDAEKAKKDLKLLDSTKTMAFVLRLPCYRGLLVLVKQQQLS